MTRDKRRETRGGAGARRAVPLLALFLLPLAARAQYPSFTPCVASSTVRCDGYAELPLLSTNWISQTAVSGAAPVAYPDTCAYTAGEATGADACGFYVQHITSTGTTGMAALQSLITSGPTCGTNGAIITLVSGATYTVGTGGGSGTLLLDSPPSGCAGKWIILRTDVSDSSLPPAGSRLRMSQVSALATVEGTTTANSTVNACTISGATGGQPCSNSSIKPDHYWLMGLNITNNPGMASTYETVLVQLGGTETSTAQLPSYIVVDRCAIDAASTNYEIHEAVSLNGEYEAVLNSLIWNNQFSIGDGQAFSSFNGTGPYLIDNNDADCSTECALFGGAVPALANVVPTDITITNNWLHHNMIWWVATPNHQKITNSGQTYQPWIKNDIEFKFGNRALVQGNVIDRLWMAVDQEGNAFQEGPLSTDPAETNNYGWSLTYRYNLLRHQHSGFEFAAGFGLRFGDNSGHSGGAVGISVHDNLFADTDGKWDFYGCWNHADYPAGCDMAWSEFAFFSGIDLLGPAPDYIRADHNDFIGQNIYYTGQFYTLSHQLAGHDLYLTNNIFYQGTGDGLSGAGYVGAYMNAVYAGFPAALLAGNVFVGANSAKYQSGYLTGPENWFMTLATTGGTIPNSTSVFTQLTFTDGNGHETPSQQEFPALPAWTASTPCTNFPYGLIDSHGGTERQFYCGLIAPPAVPGMPYTAESGGSLPTSTTINFETEYIGFTGNTTPGSSTSYTTPGTCGNCEIVITSPAAPYLSNGEVPIQGYNIYAASGSSPAQSSYVLQNTSAPIAIGTNYTLSSLLTSGTAPDTVNTSDNTSTTAPAWTTTQDYITPDVNGHTSSCKTGGQSNICMPSWWLQSPGILGSTITPSTGSNAYYLTVTSPTATQAGEPDYNVYACTTTGTSCTVKLCNPSPIAINTNYVLGESEAIATQCTGAAPPAYPGNYVSPVAPTWACSSGWPATFAALGFQNAAAGNYRLLSSSCAYQAADASYTSGPVSWQDFPNWAASIYHDQFDTVMDSNGNYEVAMNSGVTGSSAPAWNTVAGRGTNDNGITWVMYTKFDVGTRFDLLRAAIGWAVNSGALSQAHQTAGSTASF